MLRKENGLSYSGLCANKFENLGVNDKACNCLIIRLQSISG